MIAQAATTPNVTIPDEIKERFSAYATAALPFEVGGLLKFEHDVAQNRFTAIDMHIFKQSVKRDYFELDGVEVAKFFTKLHLEGRGDEIAQWCSLVHSHPYMTPYMSRPDRENILYLAGEGYAFSVIFSAFDDPRENLVATHYAQGGSFNLIVNCMKTERASCGIRSLSDETLKAIEEDVAEQCDLVVSEGVLVAQRDLPTAEIEEETEFDFGPDFWSSATRTPSEFVPCLIDNEKTAYVVLDDFEYELLDSVVCACRDNGIGPEDSELNGEMDAAELSLDAAEHFADYVRAYIAHLVMTTDDAHEELDRLETLEEVLAQ